MEFGFLIDDQPIDNAGVKITPLPHIKELTEAFYKDERVGGGWILPPCESVVRKETEKKRFYQNDVKAESSIFSLPSTHAIDLGSEGDEDAEFIVLAYGFLHGLYLAPSGFYYMNRVAYEQGKLTGVVPRGNDVEKGLRQIRQYYASLGPEDKVRFFAVVYWFLVGQSYKHAWERFDSQYKVLDGIHKLSGINERTHARRPNSLATRYGVTVPDWAAFSAGQNKCKLSDLRNDLVHEAKFNGKPLGYSNADESYDIQFRAFNLKLICALADLKTPYIYGDVTSSWVRSWDFA